MKKVKDFPTYENNPFKVVGLKVTHTNGKVKEFVDNEGEVHLIKELSRQCIVDNLEYRKVMVESLESIKYLSIPGLKLFCFVLLSLKPKKDFIILEKSKVMEYCNYKSRSSYYDAIAELLDKNIIARQVGTDNLYFINVNYVFNGYRGELLEINEIFKDEQN